MSGERIREPASGGRDPFPVGRACVELSDGLDSVRTGRHFVEQQVVARGAAVFLDDAGLVAGELLANARQHGLAPVSVCVSGDAGLLRIEVNDASTRFPVRPSRSTSAMTGRGIALVEAVASRWGAERRDTGKVVWAEFDAAKRVTATPTGGPDIDAILMAWGDDQAPTAEQRFTVVLGDR